MRSPRLTLLLVLLAILGLGMASCGAVASPRGWASPALADGMLLVAQKDKLYALDPETLQEKWRFPGSEDKEIKPTALYGMIAWAGDSIFVPTYNSKLYTVAFDTGKAGDRAFDTTGPLVGGVAVAESTVYFGSSNGNLYAIDAETGIERWPAFSTDKGIWSTPVVAGETLYVTSLDGRLYAIDTATGEELWSYKTAAGVASTPVLDEATGLVYVGGFDSRLRAIDLSSHEERWQVKADNWFWTRPLVTDGVVYAGSLDHKVYAVDAATGDSVWQRPFEAKAPVRAAPVMADGKLVIFDRDGNVYGLTPEDGTLAPAVELDLSGNVLADPLLLADGNVLVVTTSGYVVLIDPASLTIVTQRKL